MPASVVEPSVERLLGVLGGVAHESGDPCSVRVCGGRHVEQQRNGHWQVEPPDAIQAALMLKYNARKVG